MTDLHVGDGFLARTNAVQEVLFMVLAFVEVNFIRADSFLQQRGRFGFENSPIDEKPAISPIEPIPAIAPPIKFLLLSKFSSFCSAWEALPFLDLSFSSDIIILLAKICVHLLFLIAEITKAFMKL